MEDPIEPELPPTKDVVAKLVASHRELLAFVQGRVGSRDAAAQLLQDTFVRSIDKLDTIRDSATAWFYRVLRVAISPEGADEPRDEELHRVVCTCVAELADTLKPEYATALRRIEVDGVSVTDYADEAGVSSANAGIRTFRAREALRKQVTRACGTCTDHGRLDCKCKPMGPDSSGAWQRGID